MSYLSAVIIAFAIITAGALIAGALQLASEAQCIAAGGVVVRTSQPADECRPKPIGEHGVER